MDRNGNLDDAEFDPMCQAFGGIWCDCIKAVIRKVTPQKLAVYLVKAGYRPMHQPREDELGVRYAYHLYVAHESQIISDKEEITRDRNVVADFGEFYHRPVETLQSVLKAIIRIAAHEKCMPHNVAIDVACCDESQAPEVKTAAQEPETRTVSPNKRYNQGADGSLKAV